MKEFNQKWDNSLLRIESSEINSRLYEQECFGSDGPFSLVEPEVRN